MKPPVETRENTLKILARRSEESTCEGARSHRHRRGVMNSANKTTLRELNDEEVREREREPVASTPPNARAGTQIPSR